MRIRDGKIRIRDKHPRSATLVVANAFKRIGLPDGYFFKAYKIKSELFPTCANGF
jgi:hypothetical protein